MRGPLFLALSLGLTVAAAQPAAAMTWPGVLAGTAQSLHFLSDVPPAKGIPDGISLCLRANTYTLMGLPLWRSAGAYVLAERGCDTSAYISLPKGLFASGQAEGFFPAELPPAPLLTPGTRLGGCWGLGLVLAVIAGLYFRSIRSDPSRDAGRDRRRGTA